MLLILFICKVGNYPFFFFRNYQIWLIINLGYFPVKKRAPKPSILFHLHYSCSGKMDTTSCTHIFIRDPASAGKREDNLRFKIHLLIKKSIYSLHHKYFFFEQLKIICHVFVLFFSIFFWPIDATGDFVLLCQYLVKIYRINFNHNYKSSLLLKERLWLSNLRLFCIFGTWERSVVEDKQIMPLRKVFSLPNWIYPSFYLL